VKLLKGNLRNRFAKRAVIGRPKLAYFADYHALHERVNCVICEMENAKIQMFLRIGLLLLYMPVSVVGLYFDANVVQ